MAWSPGQTPTPEQMIRNVRKATENALLMAFTRGDAQEALGFNQGVAMAELHRRGINGLGVFLALLGIGLTIVQIILRR